LYGSLIYNYVQVTMQSVPVHVSAKVYSLIAACDKLY
jgi:hypothetical protein